ncbi:MAG TPA: hypothetical protein PKA63_12945 [Oligoflexia bacterium]|nr:hypothetical protein [Oligoflexia bacterium]HMP49566.1 hypothetical protein [Oligoflexia bacterium]
MGYFEFAGINIGDVDKLSDTGVAMDSKGTKKTVIKPKIKYLML